MKKSFNFLVNGLYVNYTPDESDMRYALANILYDEYVFNEMGAGGRKALIPVFSKMIKNLDLVEILSEDFEDELYWFFYDSVTNEN